MERQVSLLSFRGRSHFFARIPGKEDLPDPGYIACSLSACHTGNIQFPGSFCMAQVVAEQDSKGPNVRDLEPMFAPQSIAVIGASRRPGTVGHAVLQNLIYGGYTGVVYPVNPKAKSLSAMRCVPSLAAIDDQVDLAVIVTPATVIPDLVEEGADLGIKHFLVISAGFKEIGGEGVDRERRLKQIAEARGLSIVGPNCLGIINTAEEVRLNATFATHMPRQGQLGLISQSGALCTALLDYAKGRGIGFSRFVSFGNKVDVTEIDLLFALARDPNTKVILMYVEDLSAGLPFIDACHEITHGDRPKPILVIKTGRTTEGAAAAASHTGSLAGSDEVFDAIFEQAGVIRVESVGELFDCAEAFIDPLLPEGRGTAIVTNAGGPGIMATDACIRYGLKISRFQEYTLKSLRFQMPPTGSIKNPVDVIGDAKHDRYRAALDAVTADENVHQVVVIVTPQMMTDVEQIAHVIAEIKSYCTKPLIGCLMGLVDVFPGGGNPARARRALFRVSGRRHAGAGGQGAVCRMGAAADQCLPAVRGGSGGGDADLPARAGRRPLPAGRVAGAGSAAALRLLRDALRPGQDARRGRGCPPRRSVFPW